MPDREQPAGLAFLNYGGEMGSRMRARDWSATPLGLPETWPQSLKAAVRIMLTAPHPVFIVWGDEFICFYNDAYAASLEPDKHPSMLGRPARDAWPEAFSVFGPELEQVMRGGEPTWQE